MKEPSLLLAGSVAVLLIVGVVLVVNTHPLTGKVAYQKDTLASRSLPCGEIKGYCEDKVSGEICPFDAQGDCPKFCGCRLY